MRKIVIYDTSLCTSNLGDDIILDSIYQNMGDVFYAGPHMKLATHVPNFTPLQMLRNGFKVNFCKNADIKFICGTNLFSQKMIGKISAQWQLNLYNIPIYKNSVLIGVGATGSGEKIDFYARYLYKNVLSKQYKHSVRDEQTKRMVESLGFHAINTGCPTLWKFTPDFCRKIPTKKANDCILTVSGYENQQNIEKDKVLIEILKKSYNSLWVWIQTTEDEEYLDSITDSSKITKIYSLEAYKNVLQNENVDYIGTRLHGGVFAMQNLVRSIIISIDHRASGFHETNNIPIINRNEIENKLENVIHSNFKTEIFVDQRKINEFKSQFL